MYVVAYIELKSSKFGCLWDPICMKVNVFLSHPKSDVLYNPLLDDSEHACKSSKDGSFVQSTFG